MTDYDFILSSKSGSEFETSFAHQVKLYADKHNGITSIEIHVGDKMDKKEGTDAVIDGVRVDFTTAFSHKDHMAKNTNFDSISTEYGDIKFGIRLGNSFKGFTKFKVPVLVVGMDLENSFVNTWCDAMMESFQKNMQTILDAISDNYWNYCDEAGLEF